MQENNPDEILHQIALSLAPGIGNKYARMLLTAMGSATQVFKSTYKELKQIEGITDGKAKTLKEALRTEGLMAIAAEEMDFVAKEEIQVITIEADIYPDRLRNCADAPVLLYYKGTANLNTQKIVAVIGTRKNTDYGTRLCEELVTDLQSQEGIMVVSGLAMGIDAIAHKKCVSLGIPTVGVLGHGLDKIYPPQHKGLAKEMIKNGGLLTEFTQQTITKPENFPARNRIVAGMSDVTVVVESDIKGGALITARMANNYNRDVAAYPGRTTDAKSSGCNELIRTNIAGMITCCDDLLEMMNWKTDKKKQAVQRSLLLVLTTEEQVLVDYLNGKDAVHADELLHNTGMQSNMLAATLLQLEMQGVVKSLPGKLYRLH